MRKCLISFLLVFTVVAMMIPVGAATDKAIFTVNAPTQLPMAGEEFEVTVDISNNPGFCAIQFTLDYDESQVICKAIKTKALIDGSLSATNPDAEGSASVSAASLETIQGDGAIAGYLFEAIEDITEFDFKLKDITLSDSDLNDISYQIAGASEEVPTPDVEELPEEEITDENVGGGSYEESPKPDSGTEEEINQQPEKDSDATEEEPVEVHLFEDVKGHWAESFVNEAVRLGLFKGDDQGNFNPDDNVTRAQFVTVLWRMAGSPEVSEKPPFADIDDQIAEFKSAIGWGYANGYINGVSENTFDPNGTLTREAGMKILHYYSGGETGAEQALTAIYDGLFADSSEISQWAKNSIYWGVYQKLIAGTTSNTLSPKGTATRAQLAKILVNYIAYTNR